MKYYIITKDTGIIRYIVNEYPEMLNTNYYTISQEDYDNEMLLKDLNTMRYNENEKS